MVKKNLMVLIHPKIIRDQTDSIQESVAAYNKMRALEEYYNDNRDMLTIRPNSLPKLKDLPDAMKIKDSVFATEPEISVNVAPVNSASPGQETPAALPAETP